MKEIEMMEVELTKEQEDLLKMGSIVETIESEGDRYYYFPFWLVKNKETGKFKMLDWDNLPGALTNFLTKQRG